MQSRVCCLKGPFVCKDLEMCVEVLNQIMLSLLCVTDIINFNVTCVHTHFDQPLVGQFLQFLKSCTLAMQF